MVSSQDNTYHVTIGAEAAMILQSNLAMLPSPTKTFLGRLINLGAASLRSVR